MKTYVLMVSRTATLGRETIETRFVSKILNMAKIHTIRKNYDWWAHRIAEIQAGRAELSLRYWEGKPYKSKQIEFMRTENVGIEKIENMTAFLKAKIGEKSVDWDTIAKNDGLTFEQFEKWFATARTEPYAVIHLTAFRYNF